MAKLVTIPADGTVLVGTADPPTTAVGCQIIEALYDPGPVYETSPVTGGLDGRNTYVGKIANLDLTWLVDAGYTNSLSDFLETNEGSAVFIKVLAHSDAPVAYTYEVQAVPGRDLIGRAGQPIVSTVRLPVLARTKTVV